MNNMSDNQINQKIGILLRREIEARLIIQFKKYLSSELGEKKSKHIIREVIKGVAIEQGQELSKLNGNILIKKTFITVCILIGISLLIKSIKSFF